MKKTIFTFMLMLVSYTLVAQEEETMREEALRSLNPPEMVLGGPDGEGAGVVGAILATVDVSALGGATYSIPIQLPEGINGMQPNLSIVYNSQSGNGLLGWGWNLGGVSAITRVGTTLFHELTTLPVDFEHDRFVLDGQRLMAISGEYGCDQTEYKTEIDGLNKIVSHCAATDTTNGPAWFEVRTPEGLIMEYGRTNDSRIGLQQRHDVCLWLLNKVEDRNGNFVEYHYNKGGASYVLAYVKYTGRADYSPCYTVYLDYTTRDDEEKSFIGNNTINLRNLLTSIRIYWWEKEIARYDFEYDEESGHHDSLKYYNRLQKILYTSGCYDNPVSYNPTIINWGEYSSENSGAMSKDAPSGMSETYVYDGTGEPFGELQNKIKIPGDFNGDGYTDFVYVENADKGMDSLGRSLKIFHLCLNRGCSINLANDSEVTFEDVRVWQSNCDWVYVCDFTGDGKDDIFYYTKTLRPTDTINYNKYYLVLHAYESQIDQGGEYSLQEVPVVGETSFHHDEMFRVNMGWYCKFLVGDFIGIGRQEIILCLGSLYGTVKFTYQSGELNYSPMSDITFSPINAKYKTGDFDGDGCTEVWCAYENHNGKIYKFIGPYYELTIVNDNFLYYDDDVFLGDFNGDGHTDFLFCTTSGNDVFNWKIWLFKSDNISYPIYNVSSFLGNFGAPGYHGESIQQLLERNRFLEIADLDGDGKSDVIIRYNNQFHIFYGPLWKTSLTSYFSHKEVFDDGDAGFWGVTRDYGICVGNFLGRGNQSILASTKIFSKYPHSSHYSVESITDGMGNVTAFEYDYLMPNIIDPDEDDFYTLNDDDNLSPSLLAASTSIPLPMKAVRKVSTYNDYSEAPTASVIYQYKNALVNKTGRGFLGFADIITNSYLNENFQGKTTRHFSAAPMWQFCSLVPVAELSYNKLGDLISKTQYDYSKRWIQMKKVFMPVVDKVSHWTYDVEGRFLSKEINEFTYETDLNSSYYYNRIVRKTFDYNGVDNYAPIHSVNDCEFVSSNRVEYMPETQDDIVNWVINRPMSVLSIQDWRNSEDAIRSLVVYDYNTSNPYLPERVTTYPGGDMGNANGLATYMSYNYDAAGNVVDDILGALDGSLNIVHNHHVYHSNYRFPILARNQLGYESQQQFNSEYGELTWTKDCNGLKTSYWRDDYLGSTDWSKTPDNVYSCVAKRWAVQNGELVDDAREGSAYYVWSHSSDGSPTRVFYDASGRELRTVKVGINGQLIYLDTDYDEETGHVQKSYEPYYKGSTETRLYTEYHYDDYDRLYQTDYPDGSNNTTSWEVATGRVSTINEFEGADGRAQCTKNVSNIVGWTIENMDSGGNIVYYNYYSDGKLRSAGLNPDVEITLEYDDARNRTVINDPNYGRVENHYNAYGELEYTITPKGDMTIYEYDDLRRQVVRREVSDVGNAVDVTLWNYSNNAPTKGLLESINFKDGSQIIEYTYDDKSRVETILETRGTKTYKTSYHYDANTGRIDRVTYPTGFAIKKVYENGHLIDVTDDVGNILWHTENKNASGQITDYKLGNGIVGTMSYYPETHRLETQYATINGNKVQDFLYHYDDFGNLASRTESKYATPMTESFGYDDLNRLRTITLNGVVSSVWYDEYGRIGSKMADGGTVFYEADYDDRDRPHAIRGAEINNNAFPGVQSFDIEYTMFDKVKSIQQDYDALQIDYGYDHERIALSQLVYYPRESISKIYVGNCEYIEGPDRSRTLTYLTGPMGVFAVYEQLGDLYKDDGDKGKTYMHYLLKDHLGSITTIANAEGVIEQELSFDAWGNLRNPYTWTGAFVGKPMFDRGFTGHEHHYAFGLINMNGRMYDPLMSSFLSVDNYVQCPESSLGFNRYAYCMNNPLKYTDPDGEWAHLLIGALVGGAVNLGINAIQNNIHSVGEGIGYFAIGAFAGALSAGVGAGISSALWGGSFSAGFWGTTAAKVAMTSFETGSIIGAASGFTGSFVTCSGNAWMAGDSFSKGLGKGFLGGLVGGASGFVLGGLSGGWDAVRHHRDFYSGDILSAQEKLDVLLGVNMPDLESLGDPDAQFYATKHLYSDSGVPDNGRCDPGIIDWIGTESGRPEDITIIHRNNKIFIRNDRIELAWNGNREALETISHEWIHGVQYRSGEYGELLKANNNNFRLVADLLEYRAYQINYSRTGSSRFFERMLYYGFEKHSLFDSFMIRNGLSPLYHPY